MARYTFELEPTAERSFRDALNEMLSERSGTFEHLAENRCSLGVRAESVDRALERVSAEMGILEIVQQALDPSQNRDALDS